MGRVPRPRRRDYAALGAAACSLFVGHVLVATPTARYAAWLAVFVVWMVWFVLLAVSVIPTVDR
jgi:hypothetical protein